ncbi:hypothetical protein X797_012346 [Metarhizium robertsii]|uniref:Uncharacterized protein n=1 Tax=Metarhizium robertsii TaxID=568076 RepID=A0A014PG79_9HYPO|nr:hypothetical protein X797_012346 [Metarhizium robertsii]
MPSSSGTKLATELGGAGRTQLMYSSNKQPDGRGTGQRRHSSTNNYACYCTGRERRVATAPRCCNGLSPIWLGLHSRLRPRPPAGTHP